METDALACGKDDTKGNMTKPHQDDVEPFFITEEVEAEMIAVGYVFEPPPIVCTDRPRKALTCARGWRRDRGEWTAGG